MKGGGLGTSAPQATTGASTTGTRTTGACTAQERTQQEQAQQEQAQQEQAQQEQAQQEQAQQEQAQPTWIMVHRVGDLRIRKRQPLLACTRTQSQTNVFGSMSLMIIM